MPALIPSDLEIFDNSLIKPTYSGDCIPPWLLKSSRHTNLLSMGGSSEVSLSSSIHPKDFFPQGHQPTTLSHYFSFFTRSNTMHISKNDHNWYRYVRSTPSPSRNGGYWDHDHQSFSSWFPPPYRVLLLLSLGLIAFAFDLDLLNRLGMNPWPMKQKQNSIAIDQDKDKNTSTSTTTTTTPIPTKPDSESKSEQGTHYSQIYFLGFLCLVWSLAGWFTFRFYVDGPIEGDPFGRHAQTLQGISVLGAVAATIWPGDLLCKQARWGFGR